MKIGGIDYGSKLAGTTAIAFVDGGKARLAQCARKQDADQFILDWAQSWEPTHLFLDAPLSLPGAFRGLKGYNDFFYRAADRQANAMSPMFLGGLTARAMQLKSRLGKVGIEVLEVYPSHLARIINISRDQYKKSKTHIPETIERIRPHLPSPLESEEVSSWHQVDALLALASGFRYTQGRHLVFGDKAEGVIIV